MSRHASPSTSLLDFGRALSRPFFWGGAIARLLALHPSHPYGTKIVAQDFTLSPLLTKPEKQADMHS